MLFIITTNAFSQDKNIPNSKKIKYRYKTRESFDLGGISIKGNVISSGDITAKDKSQSDFHVKMPNRINFDPEQASDIDLSY